MRESGTSPNAAYMVLKERSFVGDISPFICAISFSSDVEIRKRMNSLAISRLELSLLTENCRLGMSRKTAPSSDMGIGTKVYSKGLAMNASERLSRFLVPETVSPEHVIMGTSPSKNLRITAS